MVAVVVVVVAVAVAVPSPPLAFFILLLCLRIIITTTLYWFNHRIAISALSYAPQDVAEVHLVHGESVGGDNRGVDASSRPSAFSSI